MPFTRPLGFINYMPYRFYRNKPDASSNPRCETGGHRGLAHSPPAGRLPQDGERPLSVS